MASNPTEQRLEHMQLMVEAIAKEESADAAKLRESIVLLSSNAMQVASEILDKLDEMERTLKAHEGKFHKQNEVLPLPLPQPMNVLPAQRSKEEVSEVWKAHMDRADITGN